MEKSIGLSGTLRFLSAKPLTWPIWFFRRPFSSRTFLALFALSVLRSQFEYPEADIGPCIGIPFHGHRVRHGGQVAGDDLQELYRLRLYLGLSDIEKEALRLLYQVDPQALFRDGEVYLVL